MMLKPDVYMLTAIALMLSLTACGVNPAIKQGGLQSAPESQAASEQPEIEKSPAESPTQASPEPQAVSIEEDMASNPVKFLQTAIRPDDRGYLYAVVYNPTNVAVANVYVRVVHFDAKTRQPDKQSISLLVSPRLEPKQSAQLQLEGVQVFTQADFQLYRVILERADLAK